MSVVVKKLKSSSMEIYVKGAPEVMGDICEPDSCAFLFLFILMCSADRGTYSPRRL